MARARGAHRGFRQPWGTLGGDAVRRAQLPGPLHSCGTAAAPTGLLRFPTAKDGLHTHTHMHFTGGYLGNPASLPASLATLCTRACP